MAKKDLKADLAPKMKQMKFKELSRRLGFLQGTRCFLFFSKVMECFKVTYEVYLK
jgi:hypothetical protein